METWITPALLAIGITIMMYMFRLTHKRIDDLRTQMQREHDHLFATLSSKIDNLTEVVTQHVTDYTVHKAP